MGRSEFWLLVLLGPPALCLAVLLILFRAYWIPTGSMKPGLIVGDYLLVNRAAYGFPALRCNLGWCDRNMGTDGLLPARGDIATFVHPANDKHYIKRVIGLPGDRVQMRDGVLHLNDVAVDVVGSGEYEEPYSVEHGYVACKNAPVAIGELCAKDMLRETLPDGPSYLTINIADVAADNGPQYAVPEGHVFVMGDNRDNSLDSRFPTEAGGLGLVPLERMVGRADVILFSLTGRDGRVLKWVQ